MYIKKRGFMKNNQLNYQYSSHLSWFDLFCYEKILQWRKVKKEDSLDYKMSKYVSVLCQIIEWNYIVKISWFGKDFFVSSILPKHEWKQVELRHGTAL